MTKLTKDSLKEMAFGLPPDVSPETMEEKYTDYYYIICGLIQKFHYTEPTIAEIEDFIRDGEFTRGRTTVKCPVKDADLRRKLFIRAQGKQLMYDFGGGRAASVRGEDMATNVCDDTVVLIRMLGLYQRTVTAY